MNWPFLMLTALPGFPQARSKSVWRAEKCRDLQNIDDVGDIGDLVGFVNVGENGHAEFALHSVEDDQPVDQSRPAKAGVAGTVGFVKAGFEDIAEPELVADFFDVMADRQTQFAGFDNARAGDDE